MYSLYAPMITDMCMVCALVMLKVGSINATIFQFSHQARQHGPVPDVSRKPPGYLCCVWMGVWLWWWKWKSLRWGWWLWWRRWWSTIFYVVTIMWWCVNFSICRLIVALIHNFNFVDLVASTFSGGDVWIGKITQVVACVKGLVMLDREDAGGELHLWWKITFTVMRFDNALFQEYDAWNINFKRRSVLVVPASSVTTRTKNSCLFKEHINRNWSVFHDKRRGWRTSHMRECMHIRHLLVIAIVQFEKCEHHIACNCLQTPTRQLGLILCWDLPRIPEACKSWWVTDFCFRVLSA